MNRNLSQTISAIRAATLAARENGYSNIGTQALMGRFRIVNVTYPSVIAPRAHVDPISDWISPDECIVELRRMAAKKVQK